MRKILLVFCTMIFATLRAEPRQYLPFNMEANGIPLIVYPVKDENPLEGIFKEISVEQHIRKLYQSHPQTLSKGDYHILLAWNLEGHRMTDVWIHHLKNWSDSGPLLECCIFRDFEVTNEAGIASGDSIMLLGREEELRRQLQKQELSWKEYLDRSTHLPSFPFDMTPTEKFVNYTK